MPKPLLPALLLLAAGLTACGGEAKVPLAYVASAGNNHVQVIDLASGKTLRKIYSGATPWRLVPDPGGAALWVQHWYSGTTAVINLDDHEIAALLPGRGPGAFISASTAAGNRFVTFDWPGSAYFLYDARRFQRLGEKVTEVPEVYDVAVRGETLHLVQFDPMAEGPRERYAYILDVPLGDPPGGAVPVSHRTGRSPAVIRVLHASPFRLTADRETNGLTLLNDQGDGRAVPTCPAPQTVLLSPDETRMVVPCWRNDGHRQSRVVSYRTDFTARPWPTITQEAETEFEGALVAGAFSPTGDRVYLVDRSGNRLLELAPRDLRLLRQIPTGDVPVDVAVIAVPERARNLAGGEGRARRAAAALLARLRRQGRPFTDLSWTETTSWAEGSAPAVAKSRRLSVALRQPDAFRLELAEGGVRLSKGGTAVAVQPDGRYWVTPRQELLSAVYGLPNLTVDEAIRHLAGDVPGSPFLHGGIAVDLAGEVEEEGVRYPVIGASRRGERVAQLWVDPRTGRPARLLEQFPVFRTGGHAQAGFGGLVETRFEGAGLSGSLVPGRLVRIVDGRQVQQVRIEGLHADRGLAPALFDPARLGGFDPARAAVLRPAAQPASSGASGPGRPVPVASPPYLSGPGEPHPPYSSTPPTSGPRLPSLAAWGVHRVPVPLELQVHNLEHGGVAIQYNCPAGCPELVTLLEEIARRHDFVLVAPYPFMDARIALTAWGRIETLERFDEPRITAFVAAYAGRDHHAQGSPHALAGAP